MGDGRLDVSAIVQDTYRAEAGKILATLTRVLGDLDAAEEALQDAVTAALESWGASGVPANPGAWLVTTARRRGVDRFRRQRRHASVDPSQAERIVAVEAAMNEQPESTLEDDRLRLIFTCCHPALHAEAQVALTLNTLGGLKAHEIARAFFVSPTTMSARLTRAKQKIRGAKIPYRVPPDHLLPERMGPVLTVVYLIFNEGYAASAGEDLIRCELLDEGIRLGRLLVQLMPDEPEAFGLLALMLIHDARRAARRTPSGAPILLADQDRQRWDHAQAAEGREHLVRALRLQRPGPFQLQAAIAAVHSEALDASRTDWPQIVALYDELLAQDPTPVVELNRGVAVAMVEGPEAGLRAVEQANWNGDLKGYVFYHAARGDLLRRQSAWGPAAGAYARALELATQDADRNFLRGRLQECENAGR